MLDRDGLRRRGHGRQLLHRHRACAGDAADRDEPSSGITRETILQLAEGLGIPAEERAFTLFDVWTAREAFMCGTMAEVVPIASVDGRTIGSGTPGPTTLRADGGIRRTGSQHRRAHRSP